MALDPLHCQDRNLWLGVLYTQSPAVIYTVFWDIYSRIPTMAEGLNVHLQCFLVAVVLFLPSLAHGSRPAFMAPEMEQNIMENVKAQPLELVHSGRKLQGRSMEVHPLPEKVKNAPPLMSRESARMVPTGPDPLHHNGGPIKPQYP